MTVSKIKNFTKNMSKKILEVVWIDKKIVRVKLRATKRRKVWIKVLEKIPTHTYSCNSSICPLYYDCSKMKSPLAKYPSFGEFCNHLLLEYPELKKILGITSINQVVPIKRIRA